MSVSEARVVMTLMVRNEQDIIAAMIEHHLAQGVAHIIITDNGSLDGTREILADYERVAPITVHDDPRQDFPQAEIVSRMAREAAAVHDADWVLNADADEFWVPADPSLTLAESLSHASRELNSFIVPVFNVLGRPVESGSVLREHVWRDERDESTLNEVGLHAQPTHNVAHVGCDDVEVLHGNHYSSLPVADMGDVPAEAMLMVYHFPWRTWEGYRQRVRGTGKAHLRSGRQPSPRHHTVRDYRWDRADLLLPFFVARHPSLDGDGRLQEAGFVEDRRVQTLMKELETRAVLPERLGESMTPATLMNEADEHRLRDRHREIAPVVLALERARVEELTEIRQQREEPSPLVRELEVTQAALIEAQRRVEDAHHEVEAWMAQWHALRMKPAVRFSLGVEVLWARMKGRFGSRR